MSILFALANIKDKSCCKINLLYMIYIFESELPLNKSIFFSLTYIFGIGKFNSFLLCKHLGFSKNLKTKNLTKIQINRIIKTITFLNFNLANNLKKFKMLTVKKLILIKCYKGIRKIKGLPVRGQRTQTNSKTAKKLSYLHNVICLYNKTI